MPEKAKLAFSRKTGEARVTLNPDSDSPCCSIVADLRDEAKKKHVNFITNLLRRLGCRTSSN
jgi:hypothetical protein